MPFLAEMNRALIREEGSRNPMTLAELEERMRRWIAEGWRVVVIELDDEEEPVGYALCQERRDEYFPERPEIYVRHLFIAPQHRSRSVGTGAFGQLAEHFFPPGARVVLEVLETNPRGRQFWERLGFQSYCTTLHWENRK